MIRNLECCCGDVCTEFYCAAIFPKSLKYHDYWVVHYEEEGNDCNHVNNYVVATTEEEARRVAEEARKKGYKVEILRTSDPEVQAIIDRYGLDAKYFIEDAVERLKRKTEELEELAPRPEPAPHTVFLVDGSGSMEPAWFEAWALLFEMLRGRSGSFSILLFKQPGRLTPEEEAGVLYENEWLALVDVAAVLRQKNLVRLKRAPTPSETGIIFRGRTPLLAAIAEAARLARESYPLPPMELVVVSDNRDSIVLRDQEYARRYNEAAVIKAKQDARVAVKLAPVGQALLKYTRKYDEIIRKQNRVNSLLGML